MNRRELVLNKLLELTDLEVNEALTRLTHHVQARLRFRSLIDRTKYGAHGEKNLGINAIDYYVGESVRKLYEPNGWDWKFEKLSFAEQLMRIANKLISDKVSEYKAKVDDLPLVDSRDASEIFDLSNIAIENGKEHVYSKLIELAHQVSKDNDELEYFVIRYFDSIDFKEIAKEMNLPIEQIYVLRKKLVRRLMCFKEELIA